MPLTVPLAHAEFDQRRREMLPGILTSWEGGVATVVTDDRRRGSWFTVRAAWHEGLRLAGGKGHILVAQDDMRVARGGFSFMQELCEANPDSTLCFRWDASNEGWLHKWAVRDDAYWARSGHFWTGSATAVPVPIVEDFLDWAREFDRNLIRPYKNADDTRQELHAFARGIEILRCRWSLMRHLGKHSVCRGAERDGDDEELSLVTDTSELPGLAEPRWVVSEDVPSAVYVPEPFKRTVEVVLGRNAHNVGLGHLLGAHVS